MMSLRALMMPPKWNGADKRPSPLPPSPAARLLREEHHMSVIDTAAVLGVTRARAYQLLGQRDAA
ncbi:MAG: hypothetical protein FWF28_02765 [Micrococcales bacterium]|nr:hypothetical protein [Micrococcales bacterium]